MFTSEAIAAGNDAMQLQVQCLVPIDGVTSYLYHGDTTQLAEKLPSPSVTVMYASVPSCLSGAC